MGYKAGQEQSSQEDPLTIFESGKNALTKITNYNLYWQKQLADTKDFEKFESTCEGNGQEFILNLQDEYYLRSGRSASEDADGFNIFLRDKAYHFKNDPMINALASPSVQQAPVYEDYVKVDQYNNFLKDIALKSLKKTSKKYNAMSIEGYNCYQIAKLFASNFCK